MRLLLPITATTVTSLLFVASAIGCGGSAPNAGGSEDSGTISVQEGGGGLQDSGVAHPGPEASTGSDGGTSPESGTVLACSLPDAGFPAGYPAAHAPLPTVTYQGAGILAQPEVVTVTFPSDALATQLDQFGDDVLQTCWWNAARQGYCSGAGGAAPCVGMGVTPAMSHVQLTTPAAASYTDTQQPNGASTLQDFVKAQVASGAFPAPTAGTIYAMYFPAGTTISLDGQTSCNAFGGYHMSTQVTPPGGTPTTAAYAVIPECGAMGFASSFAELTFSASHEISEAVTDPFPQGSSAGFYLDFSNNDNVAWNLIGGGEVGDLCVDLVGESQHTPHDQFTAVGAHGSYTVQRIWSVAAAAAGGDPCVPIGADDSPYFNVALAQGAGLQHLAVGKSVTIAAGAFSTGPLTSWAVQGIDMASLQGQAAVVSVTLDKSTVTNGDTAMVTLTLNSAPPALSQGINGAVYVLVSQSGTTSHLWPGLVVSP